MRFLRIRAITKKELIQIWRDPLSLTIALLMPVMQLFIYGYAITFDVNNITTIVYDQDRSSVSRELVAQFIESGYFTLVARVDNYKEIDAYLDSNKARVAIVIPYDYSTKALTGRGARVEVSIDGSDSNTATIAEGYIAAISLRYPQRITIKTVTPTMDPRTRVWFNPELKSRNFIIPGLIAVIMSVVVALLTSLTVAREWERGTMEQLISTPVKASELIIGKLAPYFAIGFMDMVLAVLLGVTLFGVPLRGNLVLLVVFSSVFLFGTVSFGVLISIASGGSQSIASQIAILSTMLPAFLLSGFMFAISNMPKPLQVITYFFPARYFVTILKGVFLKGSTLRFLWREGFMLAMAGGIVFFFAIRGLHKRMD
ncbi:MAG TPA: ABC transporter permease [Thermodesulfovibrionales bacterium]|nr:ABC transporter permease [Thermodesulfovibrionales bacterium]